MSEAYYKKQKQIKMPVSELYCRLRMGIFLGIFLGVLSFYLMLLWKNFELDFFSESSISELFNRLSEKELWWYLVRKRLCYMMLIFCVMLIIPVRNAILVVGASWGLYYGSFMSSALLHGGFLIFFKKLFYFFPQYFFYFGLILLVGEWFLKGDTSCGYRKEGFRNKKIKYFLKTFVIIGFFFLGVYLEMKCPIFFEEIFTKI